MPRAARLPAFAAIILMLLGALRVLNWIPHLIEERSLRRWPSLENAQRALDLPPVKLPTFFPDSLQFPASEVWAGTEPAPSILMHFGLTDRDRLGLAILWTTDDSAPLLPRIAPTRILQERTIDLEGRPAFLELAACADGRPCNRLRWSQSELSITLVGALPEKQLIRIGHSMLSK